MTTKVEFPIRRKILLLISSLVVAAISAYLALAVDLFKEDKRTLVYELNASSVRTLAAQTEATLNKFADKVKLLTQGHREAEWTRAVFEAEPDLIAYTLYSPTDSMDWKADFTVRNSGYLKLYGLPADEIARIRKEIPIPFAKVLSSRTLVLNSTLPNGAPVMTMAMAIEIHGGSGGAQEKIAVVDLRSDRILKLVSNPGIATVFVVDSEGHVLAHPDSQRVSSRTLEEGNPMVQEALSAPVAFQMKPFEWNGKKWLGAYSRVGVGGLSVLSQVEEAQAFRAARKLIEKSLLFGLFIFTAAILISGWMAATFTDPIERLVGATEKLSRWEFAEGVHVKGRDEIGKLARAFNAMAADLQTQRQQLESNQADLERKVAQRTADLETQKRQLAETQETLLQTTRLASLGEMAGVAAHEVLNPLNNMSIRIQKIREDRDRKEKDDVGLFQAIVDEWAKNYQTGGWELLQKELSKPADGTPAKTLLEEDLQNLLGIAKETQTRFIDRGSDIEFITHEITRITRLLNNMRSLSRVGGERRPLDIHSPIEETAIALDNVFKKRKVEFLKDYGSEARDLYTIVGDKDELVQVFTNLVRNSLHAIDQAKRRAGQVRISTRRNAKRVEIRITDNGTGIARENLPRLFEPNFTTKTASEGTGLGLSISRRLVRAFGGDIELEKSVEGEGSTFLIWLPAST